MNLSLVRYRYTKNVTQGVLLADGEWVADTLELPWKDNKKFISCIPESTYAIRYDNDKGYDRYHVLDVDARDPDIFIHPANTVSELLGCIAIGIRNKDRVEESVKTLHSLISIIGPEHLLDIRHI